MKIANIRERKLPAVSASSCSHKDLRCEFSAVQNFACSDNEVLVLVRINPDELIFSSQQFGEYIKQYDLPIYKNSNLSEISNMILEDMANACIPKQCFIALTNYGDNGVIEHVVMEENFEEKMNQISPVNLRKTIKISVPA